MNIKAPEGQTYIAVVSAGWQGGSWFRSSNFVGAVVGVNEQAASDFRLRKGTDFKATVFLVDDVDWSVGVDGLRSDEGIIHDRMEVRLKAKEPGFLSIDEA